MATDITAFPIETKKVSELAATSTLDGTEILQCIQSGTNKKLTVDQIQNHILTNKLFHIAELSDLPTPSSGVITLVANTTYLFTAQVDLDGNRLLASSGVTILGLSSDGSKIYSTGLTGNPLITSNHSLSIRFITIEAETPFDLDASANANQSLNWEGVNLENCTNAGTIKTYDNYIGRLIGVIGGAGFIFDGTIGTIGFTDTFFDTAASTKAISLAATLTITRRLRVSNSSFVILSGETGLEVVSGATIPNEGLIIDTCNFACGGTYLSGITTSNITARFIENRGIANSSTAGQYYMTGNATITAISSSGVFVKIAGTTNVGTIEERFDVTTTSNRAVYEGALTSQFIISSTISFDGINNNNYQFRIAKNGTTIPASQSERTATGAGNFGSVSVQDIVELSTNDYLEIFAANNGATNDLTVKDLNVIVSRL